jgi:uncharacterized protein YbaR (Trm112 family)
MTICTCGGKLQYVQRSYEYHDFTQDESGSIELSGCDTSYMDEEYNPHLECEECNKQYPITN